MAKIAGPEALARPVLVGPEDKPTIQILVIDDERTIRESCASLLEFEGYVVAVAKEGNEAQELLRRRRFDIVLIDLYMSDVPGLELLRTALETNPDTIAIMITGNPSISSSVEALGAGAWDYIPKPFSATHLQILIGRAAHAVLVARESRQLNTELERQHSHSDKIVVFGTAPAFRRAIELAKKVARTDASVFITGESGTGKELIAQFIHHHSRRSARPLVAINCAALPEPLLESEMFGHCKGAFTGAVRDKPGLLEAANGGTMFLDEVLDMSLAIQAKLLRVIQDGVVRRVGSEANDAIVNVRFIAATNRDPQEATRTGTLREDLFYRLRVVPITVPPLRERPQDIPLLADHFLRYYWTRHRDATQPIPTLSEVTIQTLCAYPWHGNVRELRNVIEYAVVLAEPGAKIAPQDLLFVEDGSAPVVGDGKPEQRYDSSLYDHHYYAARERVLADFELAYLTAVANRANGNVSEAARMAGVDRTTLYRMMQKHGLQRESIIWLDRRIIGSRRNRSGSS